MAVVYHMTVKEIQDTTTGLKTGAMSTKPVRLSGAEEEHSAVDYYDEEDDLEAFSDAELGCEDGGRRSTLTPLWKVTETDHFHFESV